jgi:predicted adenine nucleotide alpha hydrolase (AANH) superfamily ATPase
MTGLQAAPSVPHKRAMMVRRLLNLLDRFRPREQFVDETAIEFVQDYEPEEAYQQARKLMRLSRENGDRAMETFHAQVAVRIAALTGRRIGGRDAGDALYGQPTRMIDGGRTLRI